MTMTSRLQNMTSEKSINKRLNSNTVQGEDVIICLHIVESYNIKRLTANIPSLLLKRGGMLKKATRRKRKWIARNARCHTNHRRRKFAHCCRYRNGIKTRHCIVQKFPFFDKSCNLHIVGT